MHNTNITKSKGLMLVSEQINLLNDLNALFKGSVYGRSVVNDAIRLARTREESKDTLTTLKTLRRNYDIMIGSLAKLCAMVEAEPLTDSIIKETKRTYEILLKEYQSNYKNGTQ